MPTSNSTPEDAASITTPRSRRAFLKTSAIAVAAAGAAGSLAACKAEGPPASNGKGAAASDSMAGHGPAAGAPATAGAGQSLEKKRKAADAMDSMHEKGVKAFPAVTEGKGNQLIAPRIDGGVKVFELTASELQWETEPGKRVLAWAYNGQVPGPQIRVTEGDRVRVILRNELSESTAIHWHGLIVPNSQDGVPYLTQPPVKPGETYTYEFTAKNPGSHMYHSHHNAAKQVGLGLLGGFVIEPKRKRAIERNIALDYVMVINDGMHGFTINGKGFPATEPLKAKKGQKIRIRYMNEGMMIHPMHLHGMPQLVIDKDGWPLPQPFMCDTINVAPGERWDVIVDCTEPGLWAFHCHILTHAESQHGMFGMVTVLIVEE